MPFRIDDIVKRKTDPNGPRGRVIGFSRQPGPAGVLVQWSDPSMFPNPTVEPEDALESA